MSGFDLEGHILETILYFLIQGIYTTSAGFLGIYGVDWVHSEGKHLQRKGFFVVVFLLF